MQRCEWCPIPTDESDPQACLPTDTEGADLQGRQIDPLAFACVAGRLVAATEARDQLQSQLTAIEQRLHETEVLANHLSVDVKLGILTFNSQRILFERMIANGLMQEMSQRGYTLELLLLDVDRLKLHNALGGHEGGGDRALATVADCLRPLYRRRTDVLAGILHYEAEARAANGRNQGFAHIGRFDRGDEFIGVSFQIPPSGPSDRRRRSRVSLENREVSIVTALAGASTTYPLQTRMSQGSIAEEYRPVFDYTVDADGIVHAPVSATFALLRAPVPKSIADFERLFESADDALMNLKDGRGATIETQGATLDFLPARSARTAKP